MSLTNCLKKAGDFLPAADKQSLLARTRELRTDGMENQKAGGQALDELIAQVQAELDKGLAEVKAAEPQDILQSKARPKREAAVRDRTDITKLPKGRAIPESVGVGSLQDARVVARSKSYAKGRELKEDLQARVLAAAKAAGVDLTARTQETFKFLVELVKKDARLALKDNANAIGWYDRTVSRAIGALATVHPKIDTDPEHRLAFMWALAVTSNGLKVNKNFELAEKAYIAWAKTGVMPSDIGVGNAASAINDSLALFNTMSRQVGHDRLFRFMATEFEVGQIGQMFDAKAGGEFMPTPVLGAAILGPKIGNGFFSNLNGYFHALTIDRWLMRTFGRMTGTLLDVVPAKVATLRGKMAKAINSMDDTERRAMSKLTGMSVRKGMTRSELDDLAAGIAKASMKPEIRKLMAGDFRKGGNNLAKAIDGQKEAPSGPGERNWMRAIFTQALGDLNMDQDSMVMTGDMTMSDLQALLWYPERRLYDAAKSDETVADGYTDDEAPDYANAAMRLALDSGVSLEAVKAAMDKAEARGTVKGKTLTNTEKQAMMKEFVIAPKQQTQVVWEVAPDPDDAARTAQWNEASIKERARITKMVRDDVLGDLLDAIGAQPGKTVAALGGFENLINPNLITDYNTKKVNLQQARALASAVGLALDQKSVALVDGRINDTAGMVRITLDAKVEPHARALLNAIQQVVPEITGFTARGNNFDVLNFDTGLTIEELHSKITEAMDELEIDAEAKVSYGETHSELVEKDSYESHITGLRPDTGGEVLERIRGLRDRARGIVAAELGKAGREGVRGGPRSRTERAGTARRDAAEVKLSPERDGSGRDQGGRLAPLEGGPSVPGIHGPIKGLVDVAEQYAKDNGIQLARQSAYVKVDPERATRIAQAYEDMAHDPQNPAVKRAYASLITQTTAQYEALSKAGYKFWFADMDQARSQDYMSTPWNALRDISQNKQMGVFPTEGGFGTSAFDPAANPLLQDTGLQWPSGGPDGPLKPVMANDLFRAVHDAFGHGLEGAGFRADGEENAWQAHARMFTGEAVGAITSETRGQNSWLNYGPNGEANRTAKVEDTVFADQKTGLMPEWTWTEGRDGDNAGILLSTSRPMFYSQLEKAFEGVPDRLATMAAPQWKLWLDANAGKLGVKKDEVEWSGVKDYLDTRGKDKVSRDELVQYMQANGVRVGETVLGGQERENPEIIEVSRRSAGAGDFITYHTEDGVWEIDYLVDASDYAVSRITNDDYGSDEDHAGSFDSLEDVMSFLRGETDAPSADFNYDDSSEGRAKYSQYTVPGGENYRELLITLPDRNSSNFQAADAKLVALRQKYANDSGRTAAQTASLKSEIDAASSARNALKSGAGYTSSHFAQKNILAHLRVDDRVDAEGKKTLFLQEIQSDWGQDGKKKGFSRAANPKVEQRDGVWGVSSGDNPFVSVNSERQAIALAQTMAGDVNGATVPNAPFVTDTKSWIALALKRAIIMAANEGYDKVAFINGEQAAGLYSLDKQVDELVLYDDNTVVARQGGSQVIKKSFKNDDELADIVGKDLATKLLATKRNMNSQRVLRGSDLKVEATGMRQFYDSIVPQVARDVLKKLGGQLSQTEIGTDFNVTDEDLLDGKASPQNKSTQNSFTITPAMREKVSAGLPLFSPARDQTDTPAFKKWFGDSKVVDAKGKPLVVYHGTRPGNDIQEFKLPNQVDGIYFTPDSGYAEGFTGALFDDTGATGAMYPVYLSIQNPYIVDTSYGSDAWSNFVEHGLNRIELMARGFDGAILRETGADIDQVIAFQPTQIKSAIGNNGNFDGSKKDISQSPARDQTDTPEFKKWFGASKVVDAKGAPLVVYHGTAGNHTEFDSSFAGSVSSGGGVGFWFAKDVSYAWEYAENAAGKRGEEPVVQKLYLKIVNPLAVTFNGSGKALVNGVTMDWDSNLEAINYAKKKGHDGIDWVDGSFTDDPSFTLFQPTQIKSATGNNGNFDGSKKDISQSPARNPDGTWQMPETSKFDDFVYKMQNKMIDTKRVIEALGPVTDERNVYLQEELFHGRAAKQTTDFADNELKPLMQKMAKSGLTMEALEEYLHAKHAKEANKVIAGRNPDTPGLQDGGSGMTDAAAAAILKAVPASERAALEDAATDVRAILDKTRQLYADYGLESQDKVDGFAKMFENYIPLQREDKDVNGSGMGSGQGFSVKGKETKGRTGSTRKVVDVLGNIAMQRERLIVRGEKNRVAVALVGLAQDNPQPGFWSVGAPPAERVYDPKTNTVVERQDPMFKSRDNVLVAKVRQADGSILETAVVFQEDNARAVRMAMSLKNLDAGNLEGLLGISARITRYFAAINTQYNPVFGVVNLIRDVQGAMVNLGGTPLAGSRLFIARNTLSAIRGIYGDLRSGNKNSKWAELWEQYQNEGGQTGYRELFRTGTDRANELKKTLNPDGWMDSPMGKLFTANGALKVPMSKATKGSDWLFGWLSDYNEAMENGVRLAAFKAGLDQGMSVQKAASLAKNLTVNFNRKGQIGQQAGAVFAFFNAAMQGSARIGQALFDMDGSDLKTLRLSGTGKNVVYGGLVLGSMQALALAAAGFDDEDPPDFVRERSLVIPTGGKTYISIPMPLGLHVIPGLGRQATEFALSGFKDPAKRVISMTGMFVEAFNPIGSAGWSMQTLAPTALDPLVALSENRDWTGKPIARTSSNPDVPGHALRKDTATGFSKMLSEAINSMSGGNQYVAGALSPTPDQIDYLLAQVGGGVARELSKIEQTAFGVVRGENVPTFKIPLVGRFIGNAGSQASEGTAFYATVKKANAIETEVKAMRKDGKAAEAQEIMRSKPEAYLIAQANAAERQIQSLRREKRVLIDKGADREAVKAMEERITAVMARLNRSAEQLREKQAAK